MKKHTEIYYDYFGFDPGDYVPCEISGRPAVDVSHNDPRGMGGSPKNTKDTPENLMGLSRVWHDFLEANPKYYWWFQLVHFQYMVTRKPYHETICSINDPIFEEIVSKLNWK